MAHRWRRRTSARDGINSQLDGCVCDPTTRRRTHWLIMIALESGYRRIHCLRCDRSFSFGSFRSRDERLHLRGLRECQCGATMPSDSSALRCDACRSAERERLAALPDPNTTHGQGD